MELIIQNRKGQKFIVLHDECDQELISGYRWYIGTDGYVRTVEKYPKLMHRLILGITDRRVHVDHKNRNKLDNVRSNIRACTRGQNMANRRSGGRSQYLGVSYQSYLKKGKAYTYIVATIGINGKKKTLGRYKTEEEAAKAYDNAAKIHHGEFANLNFPKLLKTA